jgi:selenide, water dikinase
MKYPSPSRTTNVLPGSGCARKFPLRELKLNHLAKMSSSNSRIFLGIQDFDDVGAYELREGSLLVQSVDIIASLPVRPYDFGAICAAHCLSDLYAKGVAPQTALSILFHSLTPYHPDLIDGVFSGLLDKLNEASVALIGGHTINEQSLFCGLAVSGVVEKGKIIKKSGAQIGDVLLVTKPIGTGIISLATRGKLLGEFPHQVVKYMATLNNSLLEFTDTEYIHAATDISGAGLAGSLYELAIQNSVEIIVNAKDVPCYEHALAYAISAEEDGALFNRDYVEGFIGFEKNVSKDLQNLLFDPQTSGGLLLAVAPSRVNQVVDRLNVGGLMSEKLIVGQILKEGTPRVMVV